MLILRADDTPIRVSIGAAPRIAQIRRTKALCPPTPSQHFDVALLSVQVHNRLLLMPLIIGVHAAEPIGRTARILHTSG